MHEESDNSCFEEKKVENAVVGNELCGGCEMTIFSLYEVSNHDSKWENFLRSHSLVQNSVECSTCKRPATKSPDGFWRCQRKQIKKRKKCNFKVSVTKGSIFAHLHGFKKFISFVNLYLLHNPPRQRKLTKQLEISSATYAHWRGICQEVLMTWADKESSMIGGINHIVEIDEAKFGKRKYHRGRLLVGAWIFGGIDRDTKEFFYVPVDLRNSATLLEIIKQWIKPGTTIISDCWKAYDCLDKEGFIHQKVNHSKNFVDPETKAHTQNIERSWRNLREVVPKYGRDLDMMPEYIAEGFIKLKYTNCEARLHHFLKNCDIVDLLSKMSAESP